MNDDRRRLMAAMSDGNAAGVARARADSTDDVANRRSRFTGKGVWVAAILAAAATGYYIAPSASNPAEQLQDAGSSTAQASVPAASAADGSAGLDASGYVVASRQATVSSETTGRLAEILVKEGDRVVKGQALARLDASQLEQQIRLAQAQLDAARSSLAQHEVDIDAATERLSRVRELNAQQFASDDELSAADHAVRRFRAAQDRANSDLIVAQRRVDIQRQLMHNTVIVAPFDGMVTELSAQIGEVVSPSSAGGGFTRTGICTLVDIDSLEARVRVNEKYIRRVRENQSVDILPRAYPELRLRGRVATIMPTAERDTASVEVIVAFIDTDRRVLPNMSVDVAFKQPAEPVSGRSLTSLGEAQP